MENKSALAVETLVSKRISILKEKFLSILNDNPDSLAMICQFFYMPTKEAIVNCYDDEFILKILSTYNSLTDIELGRAICNSERILSSVAFIYINNTGEIYQKYRQLFVRMFNIWFHNMLTNLLKFY